MPVHGQHLFHKPRGAQVFMALPMGTLTTLALSPGRTALLEDTHPPKQQGMVKQN